MTDEALPVGTKVRLLSGNEGLPIGTLGEIVGYDVELTNIVGEKYPAPYPYRIRWNHILYKPHGIGADGWDYAREEFEVVLEA